MLQDPETERLLCLSERILFARTLGHTHPYCRIYVRKLASLEINLTWMPATLVALLIWCVAVWFALSNVFQVAAYRPVQVRVIDRAIARVEHTSRRGTSYTYEPIVTYRYTIGEREYTGRRVTPLGESHSEEWARQLLSRFQVEQAYQGFYNPLDPSDSYLIKRYDATPYCYILPMTLLLVLFGSAALLTGGSPLTPPDPALQPDGWYAIGLPPPPPRWPAWAIFAAGWYGLGLLSLGPYFLLAFPSYDGLLSLAAIMYVLVGAGLTYFFAHNASPPSEWVVLRLAVDTDQLVRGATITVRVELLADYELTIDDVAAGLVEQSQPAARRAGPAEPAQWVALSQERRRTQPGKPLFSMHELTLPTDRDRYLWQIVVRARSGPREYRKAFPIYVQSPPLLAPATTDER
jgi:hypothetical protein